MYSCRIFARFVAQTTIYLSSLPPQRVPLIRASMMDQRQFKAAQASLKAQSKIDSQSPTKLHAVLFPQPVQGHINPMMQPAKILVSSGFKITFVNIKYNHTRMLEGRNSRQKDFPHSPTQEDDIRFVWIADGLPPDFDYTNIRAHAIEFQTAVDNMGAPFEEVIENLNQEFPPVTCIISTSATPWMHDLASKFNIPGVFLWTQSAAVFSIYHHLPKLISNGFFPYKPSGGNGKCTLRPITYIPGIPPLQPADLPSFLHVEEPSDPTFQPVKSAFERVGQYDCILINSCHGLEKEALHALQGEPHSFHAVGPLLPSAFLDGRDMKDSSIGASLLKEENGCIQWLNERSTASVLYLSFGSLFQPSFEQVQEIGLGLKASQQHFLWALRLDSTFKNVSEILPSNFLEDTKEQGLIIPWAPQLQVLSHPSVGGFLTHCGWNSTLESIVMGVPMLPLPIFGDQPTNSSHVADVWKVGLDFKRQGDGMVKSEEVERVVRILMQEEEGRQMRCRAAKLRDAARRAMQGGGSSHLQIQKFVQAMKQRVQRHEVIHGPTL